MPAGAVDIVAVVWFAVMNVVTFLIFGFDKWRAGRAGSRVPESTLAVLGALVSCPERMLFEGGPRGLANEPELWVNCAHEACA